MMSPHATSNAEDATLSEGKLRDYLLDLDHDRGASKARVFYALGYRRERWEELEQDLREQHLSQDA